MPTAEDVNIEKAYDLPTSEDVEKYNSPLVNLPTTEDVQEHYGKIDLPMSIEERIANEVFNTVVQKSDNNVPSVSTKGLEENKIVGNMNQARNFFVRFARRVFPSSVVNANTGETIDIPRNGIEKFLSGRISNAKYASGFVIPEIVQNGVKVGQEPNLKNKDGIYGYEYYDSDLTIDGNPYKAHIRVRNTNMGNKYYGHTISKVVDKIEIEPLARGSEKTVHSVNATDSTSDNNIPQPNDVVNNNMPFKVVLSSNIPMHLVDSVNAIKKKTGIDVVFGTAYNADGSINTKYRGEYGDNRIVVSENATKESVYRAVVIHELTHGIEGTKLYNDIKDYVINRKYGGNQDQLRTDISAKLQQYKNNGVDLTQNRAMAEIVAENAEEYIFPDDIKSIVERDYTFGQKIYDLISELIYNFKRKYNLNVDELASVQRKYRLALDEVKRKGVQTADGKYSIFSSFYSEYDKWVKNGENYNISLTVGRTSEALKTIGIEDKEIKWDSGKIKKIKKEHNLNDKIIKQVPEIIENPVIIMDSLQKQSRLTILGEVYDLNNKPVLAVLELEPTNLKGDVILDEIKIASAYGKDNVQNLINNSNILYVDKNKKRINNWLTHNRLQLPLGQTNYQFSNDIVSQSKTNVNSNYMQNTKNNSASTEKTEMQLAFERAQAKKQYSFVTEEDTETGKFTDESGNEYTRVDDIDNSFGVRILEGKDESGKDVLKFDIDNIELDNVVNSEEYKRLIENAFDIEEIKGVTLTAERAFEKA